MDKSEEFVKVCAESDLKEKIGRRFYVNDVDVALFKVDGEIFAVSNICPHQKAQVIYDGFVEDGLVTCPSHGWQFDLRTGRIPSAIRGLDSYEVKITDGDVYVKAYQRKVKW